MYILPFYKCLRHPLKDSQTVRVRKEKRRVPATVVRHTNNPQSYWVRLTNGYVVRRNRTQINTTREEGLQTSSRVGPNEPNRAIVSNRVAEPNRAIVSNRVYEPTRANQPNGPAKTTQPAVLCRLTSQHGPLDHQRRPKESAKA